MRTSSEEVRNAGTFRDGRRGFESHAWWQSTSFWLSLVYSRDLWIGGDVVGGSLCSLLGGYEFNPLVIWRHLMAYTSSWMSALSGVYILFLFLVFSGRWHPTSNSVIAL